MKKYYLKEHGLKVICTVLSLFVIESCVNTNMICKNQRLEPHPFISTIWISKSPLSSFGKTVKYEGVKVHDTLLHNTVCTIGDDHYVFHIFSTKDTAEIFIHKKYIGSNLDTVRILIRNTKDSSTINIYPDASWVRLGQIRTLVSDSQKSEDCYVKSTLPVSVSIDLIVNPLIENSNPSYKEDERSRMELYSDSLRVEILKRL